MNLAGQIEEVLKLAAETGDRCIVMSEHRDPFVIMGLPQYRELLKTAAGKEHIASMTESELLDKINQDIAEWRESRQEELSEYDIAQFRVDPVRGQLSNGVDPGGSAAPNPPRARKTQDAHVRKALEMHIPNLPIVEDEGEAKPEYHLEPLE
ncbi:MAG: hypothetical protein HY422_01110 [Candidatus Komeilibacteria bacterium]|nr:hypothetical protein [Candidatus Komeilibacteria bacterium]